MRADATRPAFTRLRSKVGIEGSAFHDLRHTVQILAASMGAMLADLMKRLGHGSPAAANRYLHVVQGRDPEIAAALSEVADHEDPAGSRVDSPLRGRPPPPDDEPDI